MPTTSSPWASPSSPAGRRLLQSEPATADGIPVLDEATLAVGAALVAASSAPIPGPAAVSPGRLRTPIRRRAWSGVAAALVMGLLAVGATAGLERPAPAAFGPVPAVPMALGRAAGSTLGAETPAAPVPGGQVVVGLIAPTEAVTAAPLEPSLGRRLGVLMAALAADGASVG